jgi:dihydroxyacetone kinase-like protein
MMAQAATAAKQGAESTAGMIAKFGRARNLGQRAVGHVDAGATSLALIFQGFADKMK